MPFQNLVFDVHDRVATIRVNRPDKLNALNDETIAELDEAIALVERRDDIAGVLLTGAGAKAFVAGADIAELSKQGATDGRARAMRGQAVFSRIESCPKPVIAALNGFALGGGCELAMACHIRIASDTAKLGQPELKLGITPGYGGTQRLARLVGKGRALQLLLTADMIDAAEAHRIGLVNKVVRAADLLAEAERMLRQIIAFGPVAVALCIEAVNRGADLPLDAGLELEASYFGLLSSTEDMREGMTAFLEKRPARFVGR
ncbi:MAG TPA: enoyl-CoA hydratase-related protein [Gemmatimonadaceae bacterium]|nr:enoyl-CoA hydratase-related protein [Gemmatimonadaceae bacterium]